MLKKFLRKIKRKITKSYSVDDYREFGVTIGNKTVIYDSYIDIGHAYLVDIGENCTLTHCTILAHDASTKRSLNKSKVGTVKIGNNCFIGWGVIILPNVKIGNNCIIGAGSIISKNIKENSVVCGNPCRCIGTTDEFIKKNSEFMKTKPVFNTYWKKKSLEEKIEEKKKLSNTFGYDE